MGPAARVALLVGLGFSFVASAAPVHAAGNCIVLLPPPPSQPGLPNHHPVHRGLPESQAFHQPDGCAEGFSFFDQNGDGVAEASEPRVFGPQRWVICASCHDEHPPADSATASRVFLRQDPSRLCLVCHDL